MENGERICLAEGDDCKDCVFDKICQLARESYDDRVVSIITKFVQCKLKEGLIYKIISNSND